MIFGHETAGLSDYNGEISGNNRPLNSLLIRSTDAVVCTDNHSAIIVPTVFYFPMRR